MLVLTGQDDDTLAVRAVQEGAQDYLLKTQLGNSQLLARAIRYAVERKRAEEALLALDWIGQAIKAGHSLKRIERSPWLKDLRNDERYARLRNSAGG